MAHSSSSSQMSGLLWMLVVFLILEYIRPPAIVQLKLQMLISLILPLFCYFVVKDRRWSWTLTAQIGVMMVAAVGVLYASNYFSAYFVTRILFTTIAISISMAWLLSRLDFFRRCLWAWTLIMTYLAIYSIQHGGFGPGGIIGDENEVALACNTAVPMAYFGAVWSRGWRRWAYLAIGLLLLSAVVMTNSRGGFVGLAATVGYIVMISKHRIRTLAGLTIAGFIFFLAAPQQYIDEILSIEKETSGEIEDGTADARMFLWTAALNMWKANPVLGVGAGNSRFRTGEFQPDWEGSMYSERDWSGTAIHSGLFEALSELGSVGILLYGSFVANHFTVLRRVRRRVRKTKGLPDALSREMEMYAGALAGGMVGYLASGLFLSVAYHPYAFYFSALSLGLSWSLDREMSRLAARAPGPTESSSAPPAALGSKPPSSLGRELLAPRS
ncbi:O-antigen ligase family protein [Myxococcota bacterium]|nr:O-antigen ligase family protein [Myxococcota bacterium]